MFPTLIVLCRIYRQMSDVDGTDGAEIVVIHTPPL
jgi:hypothetical protein